MKFKTYKVTVQQEGRPTFVYYHDYSAFCGALYHAEQLFKDATQIEVKAVGWE